MSIASKDLFVVSYYVVPVLGGIFIQKGVDESKPFYYIRNMTTEEFIAKYGEEAYNRRLEAARASSEKRKLANPEWYKNRVEESNAYYAKRKLEDPEWYKNKLARQKDYTKRWKTENRDKDLECRRNYYKKKLSQDPEYKKQQAERSTAQVKKFIESKGDCGLFTYNQIITFRCKHIKDWKQHIKDLLDNEKCPEMLDVDYLYEHFKDNVEHDLYYGNVNILKFLVPLLCLKVYDGIEFNEKEIEMIKYFDNFKNTTKKKPIKYNSTILFVAPELQHDTEKCMKLMLLYNLVADFMHNRAKYPTDKKLY